MVGGSWTSDGTRPRVGGRSIRKVASGGPVNIICLFSATPCRNVKKEQSLDSRFLLILGIDSFDESL
mgnify:CR=1 FL=1